MKSMKLHMKTTLFYRITAAFLTLLTLCTLAVPVTADDEPLPDTPPISNCDAALLYNFENDRILFEYNAAERVYPTSTVKIMTAIVAMEAFEGKLDSKITVTQAMLDEVAGNRIGFYLGESVTVEQMLYCMLVNSANDAAIILAHGTAGSTQAFVAMMNEKAAWLGAYNTYYMNPTGMHNDAQVTTARDTALIAQYAYSLPGFIDMTSTPKYVMEGTNISDYRTIYNRNCLISNYYRVDYKYSQAVGMNAGSTTQGGYCIAAVAEDGERGLTYLSVVLGADSDDDELYNYVNAISMFDWAFEAYDYTQVLSQNRMICEIPVALSSTIDYVTLVPSESMSVYLPTSVDISKDIRYSYNTYDESLNAPVEAGMECGQITVLYGDEILGSCSLITTSSITRSEFLYFLSRVQAFSEGRFFRGTVIAVVVLSVLYVLIQAGRREKKIRHAGNRYRYK
ncbi:MAG: D-alanyl-D-alanine carboxypeptidase [Clostridia bacterium]|nr:D-alanyl-D-alanine carboxypeptidase [Clostridia bacterium]MBQ8370496.1 D-alanyl-D-alanine carboxypeptidase [Clostridia bacterium]